MARPLAAFEPPATHVSKDWEPFGLGLISKLCVLGFTLLAM